MNQKVRSTLEQLKHKLYPSTQPTVRNNTKKAKAVVKKAKPSKAESTNKNDQKYITFLENRMSEWQAEARKQAHEIRKQAHEINHLKAALAKSHETRNVTSEVTEVMEEVMELRATVAYLESKLFGGK